MPSFTFDFRDTSAYTFDGDLLYISGGTCSLPLLGSDGEFDSRGGATTPTDIEFPEWSADALTDLTGAQIIYELPTGADLGFRASPDSGTTWYYYDGADWLLVTAAQWTALSNFDAGIADLFSDFPSKRYTFKMNLTPNAAGEPPIVKSVHIMHELEYSFYEDIKRTLKQYLDANITVLVKFGAEIGSTPIDEIPFVPQWETVGTVQSVYDITNDPDRLVNLFASMVNPTLIKLTSSVVDAELHIYHDAKAPVFIAVDANLNMSVLPAYVLRFPAATDEYNESHPPIDEYLKSKGVYRTRKQSSWERIVVQYLSLSTVETDTLAMQSAISQHFETQDANIISIATGKRISVLTFTPLDDNDIIQRGLHVKAVAMEIEAYRDYFDYVDNPVLQSVRLSAASGVAPVERSTVT